MAAPYQPEEPKGSKHYPFSVPVGHEHIHDLLRDNPNRSAVIREALECFLVVYSLFGKDWRLKLHEQHKPAWADEMERRLAKKLDNIRVVTMTDNGPEKDEDVEVEIGKGIFHEE